MPNQEDLRPYYHGGEAPIFSGEYSQDMWKEINGATTVEELKAALYTVCCRLQVLESSLIYTRDILVSRINDNYNDIKY